jgi:nitrogen fixation NifU-like protein
VDNGGRIEDAFFQGEGCCVSQSAASMLVEHCQGKTLDALRSMRPLDMLSLFDAPLTTTRQKCCLLCWRVLQSALVCPHDSARLSGSMECSNGELALTADEREEVNTP